MLCVLSAACPCRKLAAQKGMLNRGEAPAAQLFKISEQAEIRYTNNGLLYEVPADEVASNPSSANSQPLGSSSSRLAARCAPGRLPPTVSLLFRLCRTGLLALVAPCFAACMTI